jgi:Protein of unknown function (DUF3618)
MDENSSQITREIENTRAELGSNLQELERRVKGMTDWRQQFAKSPVAMIGLAFGGGILLGAALGGRHAGRSALSLVADRTILLCDPRRGPHAAVG